MIVQTIQRSVVESHDFKSEIATIDPREMRYISSLLRNNYSDTILATVRETFANAIDANKEANSQSPVEIVGPTDFSPTYTVRDFGFGLSEKDLFGLYTKYGRSTKRKDNGSIGGFGIGRFAPLSYTDSFTVVSRHKGKAITISVYVDELGDTRFTKLNEVETSEPSGLEISVAVKSGECETFARAIQQVTQFNENNFVCKNVNRAEINWVIKTSNWGVKESVNHKRIPLVVMGGVAYPLDLSTMHSHPVSKTEFFRKFSGSYCSQNFVFFFPIGAVSLHHSREALEYNTDTKNYIARAIEALEADVTDQIQQKLDGISDSSSFFETLHSTAENIAVGPLCRDSAFKFTGPDGKVFEVSSRPIQAKACYIVSSRSKSVVRHYEKHGYGRHKTYSTPSLSPSFFYSRAKSSDDQNTIYIVVDDAKHVMSRVTPILLKNPYAKVFVFDKDVAEKNFLINYNSNKAILFASKLEKISTKKASGQTCVKIFSPNSRIFTYYRLNYSKELVPSESFYYLRLKEYTVRRVHINFGGKVYEGSNMRGELVTLINFANQHLGFDIKEVYGFCESDAIPSHAIDLEKEITEKFKQKLKPFDSVLDISNEAEIYASSALCDGRDVSAMLRQFKLSDSHVISQFLQKGDVSSSHPQAKELTKLRAFVASTPVDFFSFNSSVDEKIREKIRKEWLTIQEKYPMLMLVLSRMYYYHRFEPSDINSMVNYINLVDKTTS